MILAILEPLAWMGERFTVPLLILLVLLLAYSMHNDPVNQPAPQETP